MHHAIRPFRQERTLNLNTSVDRYFSAIADLTERALKKLDKKYLTYTHSAKISSRGIPGHRELARNEVTDEIVRRRYLMHVLQVYSSVYPPIFDLSLCTVVQKWDIEIQRHYILLYLKTETTLREKSKSSMVTTTT